MNILGDILPAYEWFSHEYLNIWSIINKQWKVPFKNWTMIDKIWTITNKIWISLHERLRENKAKTSGIIPGHGHAGQKQ